MNGENACPQNGTACAEVQVLTRTYQMLSKSVDEKFKRIEDGVDKQNNALVGLASRIEANHAESLRKIDDFSRDVEQKMDKNYVRKESFKLVRTIVYGMAGMILVAFFGAVITLIIKSNYDLL